MVASLEGQGKAVILSLLPSLQFEAAVLREEQGESQPYESKVLYVDGLRVAPPTLHKLKPRKASGATNHSQY